MMSIFYRSFTELFKLKVKNINLLLFCQLVSSLALTFFSYFHFTNGAIAENPGVDVSFIVTWLTNFFYLSFFFVVIYYLLTCISHEHVNQNQTWRLIPISSTGLYADNMLSSFIVVAFFCLIEIISNLIFLGISMLLDQKFAESVTRDVTAIFKALGRIDYEIITNLFSIILILFLFGFLFYFIVDFLNFISRSIADFIPGSSGRTYIRAIIIFLIILLTWTIINANDFIKSVVLYPILFLRGDIAVANYNLPKVIIILLVFDILLASINLLLYNKFFEAKEKK